MHKEGHGLWLAYSRWPDKARRDAAWPGDNAPNETLPSEIQEAIKSMQVIKQENQDLEQYAEICLEIVTDLLVDNVIKNT